MSAHPQLYLTAPAPCPYVEGEIERKVFTHLVGDGAAAAHEELVESGFRRSQHIAYRPACENCRACVSARVVVDQFRLSRSMKRVRNRNRDLIGEVVNNVPTGEQYSLFRRYVESRHTEGGMAHMTVMDYAMMVEDSHVRTGLVEYRRRGPDSGITGRGEGPLLAVMLIDKLSNGLSLVYSFFDPEEAERSLGTFMIVDCIERSRREGLPYCHLGYVVDQSPKMAYKARFQPQERLLSGGWSVFDGK